MGSSPKTVAAPDPIKTAQAQGQANMDAAKAEAELNRYNQSTPFGDSTWAKDPNSNQWSNSFKLNPQLQGMLDSVYGQAGKPVMQVDPNMLPGVGTSQSYKNDQMAGAANGIGSTQNAANLVGGSAMGMSGQIDQSNANALSAGQLSGSQIDRLKGVYGQDFNYDKLGAMPTASDDTRKTVEDAYYKSATSRLDPQFAQADAEMRSRLANQGLTEGSEAYNRELQQFNMGRTDAYGAATNSAIMNSTSEMAKQFQMQLAARQQGVGEQNYIRELATKEAQAAQGLAGGASAIDSSNRNTQSGLLQNEANLYAQQSALKDAAGNRAAQSQAMDYITRDKALNEQLTMKGLEGQDRTSMINSLLALTSGSQMAAPGAGQVQVGAAPVAQSIYNSQQIAQDGANAKAQAKNSTIGTLGSLAGTAMMATSMF